MKTIRDPTQGRLFDPFEGVIGPTGLKLMENGWQAMFRDTYRWRAGIEATNSTLKRLMGLKRLRVRGLKAVKTAVLLKLAGWNVLRAVALRAECKQSSKLATNML